MNLAIISPQKNGYSETFIQAHKQIDADKILFYYGGNMPTHLEGQGVVNICREGLNKKNFLKFVTSINPFLLSKGSTKVKESLLAKSFKKNKVDVVLAEFGETGVACMNVCEQLNIPLITHFHGYDITADLKRLESEYKALIKKSAFVVGVSKEMVETLIQLGASPQKAIYTPCGPNPKFFETKADFTNKNFLSVGRFVDKKAPYHTIIAFKDVIKKHPDSKLLMVGEGPLLNACKNITKVLSLTDNVLFLGVKTPDEIFKLHQECFAFVQHSITADNGDKEGTPVGIMEASASGLAVISTFHAGIKDVVLDGETGLLCDEQDVLTMSNNMIKVLDDKEFARRLGESARKRIKSQFTLQHHIDTLSKTVREACQNHA